MKTTSDEYARLSGIYCPMCGDDNIEGESVQIDGGVAWQEITCSACLSTWNDVYNLVGYDTLKEGER